MDTIFALCTPPGKSGIAVVRVSGPCALSSLEALGVAIPQPRVATLAALRKQDEIIDHALVMYFKAPHSFTGEETVEYHIHGSRAVIHILLTTLGNVPGLRPAEAGEFARRAFLNGKMDLTAAEGLADLIDAETEAQRSQALRIMQGESAAFYHSLRTGILEALSLSEAYIDFPDEEIPTGVLTQADAQAEKVVQLIESQLAGNGVAERIRDGVRIAIIGPPNVGKSSLMNLLAKRDVAIVSQSAGTTRDVIEVHLDIGGYAVIIADTAGLREAQDGVEREGIRRSFERARDADIRLIVLDAQDPAHSYASLAAAGEKLPAFSDSNTIILLNKIDMASPVLPYAIEGLQAIAVSVKENTGIDKLLLALHERVITQCTAQSSFITRQRHRRHLTNALEHLQRYASMQSSGLELKSEELRRAAVEIGRITGAIAADEVLGQIFSRFCIGK